jgi:hypothetical protein
VRCHLREFVKICRQLQQQLLLDGTNTCGLQVNDNNKSNVDGEISHLTCGMEV